MFNNDGFENRTCIMLDRFQFFYFSHTKKDLLQVAELIADRPSKGNL